jgi:serine/threonine protein kinase
MPLRIGDTFAGYRILRLLGSGGMGEVYLVQHPRLPRQDALKVLRPDICSDASFRERFIREADLAAALRHQHIVGVHDRGEHEGQLWIAMDYIDGTDAAQLLEQRYPAGMPAQHVAAIITGVASALDFAYKRGLLHRDVKPANIIVADLDSEDERIFLADFGVARPVDDISGITTTNMTVGTVAYAAPEQLMGEDIDGRADQYALAATAFHMLTGSQLFPHSNPAVVISRHLNAPPPALSDSRPDLAAMESVLATALSKNPKDRFTRCAEFARALDEVSHAQGSAFPIATTKAAPVAPRPAPSVPSGPDGDSSLHPSSPARRIRFAWLLSAAGFAIILLAAVVGLVWQPWVKKEPGPATDASPSSPAEPNPGAATSPPPPPAPPVFPAKSIDRVLLTADQLSSLLGVDVSSDPSLGGSNLAMDASAYGTSDHASQVTPRSCVGVIFAGEQDVYGPTNFEAIKTQTFGQLYAGTTDRGPYVLQQTAVVFRSAEQAQAIKTSSQAQWNACSNTQLDATLGYENGRSFTTGNVQTAPDAITIAMASNDGLNGPDACQQVLGVRDNVVVEARTCQVPAVTAGPEQGFPKDPAWATPDAERVVEAMLNNVALKVIDLDRSR